MSSPQPDDELLDELRSMLRSADAAPAEVTEFAKAALGWRRLDADLAELLTDSALETEAAATRSEGAGIRSLTFQSSELTIDVDIQSEGTTHVLLAQLAPAAPGVQVEAQSVDGQVASTSDADDLGRVRLALEGSGSFRLRVTGAGAMPIETSWFSL
jgi:hypothetical protein